MFNWKSQGPERRQRLHTQTPNIGRFHIVVFAGEAEHTKSNLKALSEAVNASILSTDMSFPISWVTLSATRGPSAFEVLGVMPFGKVFYDQKHTAHFRYGVDLKKGGIFVLRPDGWIATATELNVKAVAELEAYFKSVLSFGK